MAALSFLRHKANQSVPERKHEQHDYYFSKQIKKN
jgi:hypothetical protein